MSISNYKLFFEEKNHNYWGKNGAGCVFLAHNTGKILLAHRSLQVGYESETWATWGGAIDGNDTPIQTVKREIKEETNYSGEYEIYFLWMFHDPDANFRYYNYIVIVPHEFIPNLNWENDDYEWVEFGNWPSPLHFGLKELILHAGNKIKRLIRIIKVLQGNIKSIEEMITNPPPTIHHHIKQNHNYNILNKQDLIDAYLLASTVWLEARGEGEQGIQAVINVIMNRANGNFRKTKDIILKPYQFSAWNNVKNPIQKSLEIAKKFGHDPNYRIILNLVDQAIKNKLPDITGGATFYFNPHKVHPSWANRLIRTKIIGNHVFYRKP